MSVYVTFVFCVSATSTVHVVPESVLLSMVYPDIEYPFEFGAVQSS